MGRAGVGARGASRRAALLAAGGALVTAPVAVRAQTLTPIRVGTTAFESYGLAIYAAEGGFFRKHGLDANVSYFAGGGFVLAALIGGSLEFAATGIGSLASAYLKGVPVVAVAGGALYNSNSPTSAMIAPKNSPLRTGRDLAGKTVSLTTIRDMQQASVMRWVDADGGDSSTVKFIEMNMTQAPALLAAGRVDAGVVSEPVLSSVKDDFRILTKSYDMIARRFLITVHVATRAYLRSNAETARRFEAAMNETAIWANANHAKTAEIMARVAKLPEATIDAENRSELTERVDVALIAPVLDATLQYHFIPRPISAADLIWDPGRD